jgi:hypothetical protein
MYVRAGFGLSRVQHGTDVRHHTRPPRVGRLRRETDRYGFSYRGRRSGGLKTGVCRVVVRTMCLIGAEVHCRARPLVPRGEIAPPSSGSAYSAVAADETKDAADAQM